MLWFEPAFYVRTVNSYAAQTATLTSSALSHTSPKRAICTLCDIMYGNLSGHVRSLQLEIWRMIVRFSAAIINFIRSIPRSRASSSQCKCNANFNFSSKFVSQTQAIRKSVFDSNTRTHLYNDMEGVSRLTHRFWSHATN